MPMEALVSIFGRHFIWRIFSRNAFNKLLMANKSIWLIYELFICLEFDINKLLVKQLLRIIKYFVINVF